MEGDNRSWKIKTAPAGRLFQNKVMFLLIKIMPIYDEPLQATLRRSCKHPAIMNTPIILTAATSQAKINYRRLTQNKLPLRITDSR